MSTDMVFFLHRLGIKIFRVSDDLKVSELVDIPTIDLDTITPKLAAYQGSTFRLLISDTISYLFHSLVPKTNTAISREVVLQQIKGEIPENFETTSWDYKIINQNNDHTEVLVFAPVSEYQELISQLAFKMEFNFEVIEPESIAITRHPNPILGILNKDDLSLKDEQSLNISVTSSSTKTTRSFPKWIVYFVVILLFIGLNYFLFSKYRSSQSSSSPNPIVSPIPSLVPSTPTSTPPASTKSWTELKIIVKNGSGKTGYAGTIAEKFKESGLTDVSIGNADRDDYSDSLIIFSNQQIKDQHLAKFNSVVSFSSANIQIDKSVSFDAIIILGIN